MTSEAKRLQAAFVQKEQKQDYLSNLERLKTEGSVTTEQYATLKADYQQRLTAAVSEIANIKSQLKNQLHTAEQDLIASQSKLETVAAEHKAGKLTQEKYHSLHKELTQEITSTESIIVELQRLIGARSSADSGTITSRGAVSPPIKVEEVRVKEVSRMLPGRAKLGYTGKGEDILGRVLLWGILSVVTLGIYSSWAINHLYRYIIEHVKVDMASQGKVNLGYTGRGEDILGRVLLWGILTVVTLGIYSPWAINNLYRYIVEHTQVDVY